MLWKEITIGFLLAGFIGLLGDGFFNGLFVTDAPGAVRTIESVVVGPLIGVLSFMCSVGNVPLAAVRSRSSMTGTRRTSARRAAATFITFGAPAPRAWRRHKCPT